MEEYLKSFLHQPPCKLEVMAVDTGAEFNPATERHFVGFVVKIVDPGCTLEVQIEERDGRVTRLTSTDAPDYDRAQIRAAVDAALDRLFKSTGL